MPVRRAIAPLVLAFVSFTTFAAAQDLQGILSISAAGPDPATAAGARVEIVDAATGSALRSATMRADGTPVTLAVPAGEYELRVTRQDVGALDYTVTVAPHEVVSVSVRLTPADAGGESTATIADRFAVDYRAAFTREDVGALPHSRTLWSLVETAHPFLVADRIDGGGLYTGEAAALGGQGSSATQTTFRLDGVDVTDPLWTGTPLFYPDLTALGLTVVQSASIDTAAPGPGPSIELVMPRPSRAWSGEAQVSGAPGALQSEAGDIPPIARLQSWIDGGASGGGSLGNHARLFASGRVTSGRRVERDSPVRLEARAQSVAARLVATPARDSTLSVFGGLAAATRPFPARARFADRDLEEDTRSLVLHATWARAGAGLPWSIGAGYQRGVRDADIDGNAAGGVIERLRDGPPLAMTTGEWNDSARWILTARALPASRRWLKSAHVFDLGGTISGSRARAVGGLAQPLFGELVNGTPARVWQVAFRGPESQWSALAGAAFVTDQLIVNDALSIAAALRLDADHGTADGGADDITWFDVSPRLTARWRPLERRALSIVTGYGWYRHRLPLSYFAVGDPNGPAGVAYRWDDRNGDRAWTGAELTAVAGVGPAFALAEPNRIDPDLKRPTTREFRIGGEDVIAGWRLGVTGLDRREDDLVVLANTGVTLDDYTVTFIDDPGVDIAGLSGSAPLPIYNRRPESFLQDRFVLTNSTVQPSRFQSVDVVVARQAGERWFVRFGGTAYRSEGIGASRGYRSDENDQGLLGEAFVSPNATTYARGRLFYDRGYMMKVLGAYAAPRVVSGSFVARYQDGQPFSRLIVANGLNQGTDVVQTYPRGGQRFTYTLTVDARLVAEWPLARQRAVGVTVEAFNLLNMANEVEEDVVTGPGFRTVTAVQPPRVVRLGVRFTF